MITTIYENLLKHYQQIIIGRKKGACGCSEQSPTIGLIFVS